MILGFINKTDLTWQDRFPSDLVGLWVVFFRRVASRCSQRKKPWNEMKSCSFSDQEVYTGFLEKGAQRKEAEHLQHIGGDENAPTVATGVLYLKGAGQSAALFMQRRLSFCSASHHRCARCWLSLFILFARSDFLRQPDYWVIPVSLVFEVSFYLGCFSFAASLPCCWSGIQQNSLWLVLVGRD